MTAVVRPMTAVVKPMTAVLPLVPASFRLMTAPMGLEPAVFCLRTVLLGSRTAILALSAAIIGFFRAAMSLRKPCHVARMRSSVLRPAPLRDMPSVLWLMTPLVGHPTAAVSPSAGRSTAMPAPFRFGVRA
jgi:hypothetical protein